MNATDEQFAQALRARVDAVAPPVDVELHRVLPRARRRRATLRGTVTTATLVVVLGAGWGARSALVDSPSAVVVPAGPTSDDPVPTQDAGAATAPPEPRPTVPAVAVTAEDGTVTGVPGDPWEGDERYWYVLTESRWPETTDGETVLTDPKRTETWHSRERPGLMVWDGDPEMAAARGSSVVLGSFVVAGQRYEMLTDPRVLPTGADELAQVLRDSLEDGRGGGSDDDKVYVEVLDVLSQGGLWTPELRSAFWDVAASLPGADTTDGQDGAGRAGQVLRYTDSSGAVHQLVRDPATGLLLEYRAGEGYTRYLEQRPVDDVPVEPTLEIAGCARWESC